MLSRKLEKFESTGATLGGDVECEKMAWKLQCPHLNP